MNNTLLLDQAEERLNTAREHNRKNELAQAVTNYQEAVRLFGDAGDDRGGCRAWLGLAKALGKQQKFEASGEAFGQSAHFAARADWPDKRIEALYNQGLTLQQMGLKSVQPDLLDKTIRVFEEALEIARRIEDQTSQGVLLVSLGFACAWLKQDSRAIAYFTEAVPFALDNVDFDTAFSVLSSLGVLLSNQGRGVEAIVYYERALKLATGDQGDLVAIADTYANLGVAYEKAGRLDDAIEATDTWREILTMSGDVGAANADAMLRRLQNKVRLARR